jgi:uncharacterized protein
MNAEHFALKVDDKIGTVSAEFTAPEKPIAVMALAHGAGAPMSHPFMVKLSHELALERIATLRFNFPYMEQGKSRVDSPAVSHKTVEAALIKAYELFPGIPIIASGKSFGGRMSSQLLAQRTPDFVKAIVFFGFPLHPAGSPSVERAEHLKDIIVPMLFLQGTKDALANIVLVEKVCHGLQNASLIQFENADHSFKRGKKDFIVDLSTKTKEWLTARNIV